MKLGTSRTICTYVHVLRSPIEVSLSQQKRAASDSSEYELGRQFLEGAALWLSLTAQALRHTLGQNNFFLTYTDLLQSPEKVLAELAEFCGLPVDTRALIAFKEDFADPSLHRNVESAELRVKLKREFPQILSFFEAYEKGVRRSATGDFSVSELLAIYGSTEIQTKLLHAMTPGLARLSTELRSSRREMEQKQQEFDDVIVEWRRRVAQERAKPVPLRNQILRLEDGIHALKLMHKEELSAELSKQRDTLTEAHRTEVAQLSNELEEIDQQRRYFEDTMLAMRASTSWRLTKPLRWIMFKRRALVQAGRDRLIHLRLRGIYHYRRFAVRHPRLAHILRAVLQPVKKLLPSLASNAGRIQAVQIGPELAASSFQAPSRSSRYEPMVSVIVPNFNHEPFLEKRLESIFAQTYPHFEVILLDDASTDGSSSVSRSISVALSAKYPRLIQ